MQKKTQELLTLMKSSKDYETYSKTVENELLPEPEKLADVLAYHLSQQNRKKEDVIKASGLSVSYGYNIFKGERHPGRDKVIMLCIGLGLDAAQTQTLLQRTGYAALYGRVKRDNAILFGLDRKLSVMELNELLYELGLEILW